MLFKSTIHFSLSTKITFIFLLHYLKMFPSLNHLISRLNLFNLPILQVDPFFHKTSATFDEGGTGGLLLNHLHIKDESYELTLDSRNKIVLHEEPATYSSTNPVNLAPFKGI